jgi:hypothetical protein
MAQYRRWRLYPLPVKSNRLFFALGRVIALGFVAQIKFELGFSLTPYLSKNTLCRWRTQMSETV